MDFTRVDTEVEARQVVENWSVELHMHGLFAINYHGVWFYLTHSFNGEDVVIDMGTRNNPMPHPGDTTRLMLVPTVLYFYPRDNTAVCTAEACAFRDSYELLKQARAEVIGISSDSVESHQQFAAAHQLPFILLSDVDSIVRKLYGVPTAFGLPGRVTYVIDRQGRVRRIFFSQITSEKHVTEALSTLQSIREEHI